MNPITAFHKHPALVEFGSIDCCALRVALSGMVHHEFVRTVMQEAEMFAKAEGWPIAVLKEIFEDTTRIGFIPQIIHRKFYAGLAVRERMRLKKEADTLLDCNHSRKEHIDALGRIIVLMSYPQAQN